MEGNQPKILPADGVLGTKITYLDYLGYARSAVIGWIEQYEGDQDFDDGLVVWVYVVDDDPEFNVQELIMTFPGETQPRRLMYADMRLSTEVILDKED